MKYLIKNILEKKTRTALILLAISVSSALFFATQAISTTSQNMMEDRVRQFAGSSDIIIRPQSAPMASQYLDSAKVREWLPHVEYALETLEGPVLFMPEEDDVQYIQVMGIDRDHLEALHHLWLYDQEKLAPFEGNKIIISTYLSGKYDLTPGSVIHLEASGNPEAFTVAAVHHQRGFFANESEGLVAIMPKKALGRLYDAQDRSNTLYIRLTNPAHMQEHLAALTEIYTDCDVSESINQQQLKQSVSTVSLPFAVVSLLALFISVFIIYTSFTLMTKERLPVTGTFRSVGAAKRHIHSLLVVESLVLGMAGGIVGCLLGILALYFMSLVYIPNLTGNGSIAISFSAVQLLLTFFFAVILTAGSAVLPILKTTKLSVKDVLFHTGNPTASKRKTSLFPGAAMFLVSLVIPRFLPASLLGFVMNIVCLTGLLASMILLVPALTRVISKTAGRSRRLSGEAVLALKNLEDNESFFNNIRLISVSLAGILLIMTLSLSMRRDIEASYTKYHQYDIVLSHRQADTRFIRELSGIKGISSFASTVEAELVEIINKQHYLNKVYGIDNRAYFDFVKAEVSEDAALAIEALDHDRNALVTHLLMSNLGLSEGDTLMLDFNGHLHPYIVTGWVDSSLNIGNMVFISAKNMKRDMGLRYFTHTYIKASEDTETVLHRIKRTFLRDILLIRSVPELMAINKGFISGIFDIIIGYSLLAVLIGIIGIINNLLVSFLERKRYLAIYRSVGMSKKQLTKMLILESSLIGLVGVGFALVGALALILTVPSMLRFMYGDLVMQYSTLHFVILPFTFLVAMVSTSVIPVTKSKKLGIMETINYE